MSSHASTAHPEQHKLGQLAATAICGNDILSSALYVSGIAILFAGVGAPIVLLLVGAVLWLYKKVYTEVVEALPINGGAYNCLLNGTSKTVAAMAGVMTFLSYIATAVISAKVGSEYLNRFAHLDGYIPTLPVPTGPGWIITPVMLVTIAVLFFFALLVISGVKDSARVAILIFTAHIVTLIVFVLLGAWHAWTVGPGELIGNLVQTRALIVRSEGLLPMLSLAFSASLLGVSGFESSANFVEEQRKGVFRKTLRNMLIGVAIFNPLVAFVVLQAMPYDAIVAAKDFLLADAAYAIGGRVFEVIVIFDAFLVLAGAVMTSYVGVSGLLSRMSIDNCVPSFLGKENRKGAFPRIVLSFFVLCASILILTQGELLSLAGVYTIAFLGVMSLFALGNLILKETRPDLKRTYRAPILAVGIAFLATFYGIFGNIRIDPRNLAFFELYFIPTAFLVLLVVYQDRIFKILLRVTRNYHHFNQYLRLHFSDITDGKLVAFIHHASRLQQILSYIDRNETGWNITLVHCQTGDATDADEIRAALPVLQKAGFYTHFTIKLLVKKRSFGPGVISEVSRELGVRKNRIFIGSIHHDHAFDYDDLGGARIIFE